MKKEIVKVSNLLNLISAFTESQKHGSEVPSMGLVYSDPGLGKTTATAYTVNLTKAIYLRANALWSPSFMMSALLRELGASPLSSGAKMLSKATDLMKQSMRALFVDEADYLFSNPKMLEALRDVHDMTGLPVWLIGMDGIEKKIVHREKLARRIGHWIEFQPCNLTDIQLLAKTVCEVSVADNLIAKLHEASQGSIGRATIGLSKIERFAKEQ